MTTAKDVDMRARMMPLALALVCSLLAGSCGRAPGGSEERASVDSTRSINLYSGRQEELVGPLISKFEAETGIEVNVKYGSTAELAALLSEEAGRSRADMFLAQDAGALGAVAKRGMFSPLPPGIRDAVPPPFRSPKSDWVGITGRVRTVVFNPDRVSPADLPASILDFSGAGWKDRIGWAPTNGSFQAFVTALRKLRGERTAREWLESVKANNARIFPSNIAIVQAVGAGEIDVGFVNHYYVLQMKSENPGLKAENHFLGAGDPGALVNVSGAGILKSSDAKETAARLISYFLSPQGQRYWAGEEFEYPLTGSEQPAPGLPPLSRLQPPDIQLSDLDDLEGTLQLLSDVGLT